ncbi:MAG: hypothetical protein PF508_19470 [Spirochaeta sp.]|jgi:hypothetical protein|nr:hypothetical protein [Spirochaeta sp.]
MAQIVIVILSDTETHADHGRLTNAFELAAETTEQGGEARIVFDGAGTRWVPKLAADDGPMGKMFRRVRPFVDGACSFCAAAFHVKEAIQETDVPLLSDFEGHPSLAGYLTRGFQIVTF